MTAPATCRPALGANGLPQRGDALVARDAALYRVLVQELLTGDDGWDDDGSDDDAEPVDGDAEQDLPVAILEEALAGREGDRLPGPAFIAGRCVADDADADARLTALLRRVLADLDLEAETWMAPSYVEAAMSLVLRGEPDGVSALRGLVGDGARANDYDYLSAYYLAQTGDPTGYPAMLAALEHPTGHYRLMAARHLVAFRPYDGQDVLGHVVDVRGRLLDRLDDEQDLVANEIPSLLAEADVDGLRELIEGAIRDARHPETRQLAEHVLDDLTSA